MSNIIRHYDRREKNDNEEKVVTRGVSFSMVRFDFCSTVSKYQIASQIHTPREDDFLPRGEHVDNERIAGVLGGNADDSL